MPPGANCSGTHASPRAARAAVATPRRRPRPQLLVVSDPIQQGASALAVIRAPSPAHRDPLARAAAHAQPERPRCRPNLADRS
eukprot:617430-Prymnesium_polylepis.1